MPSATGMATHYPYSPLSGQALDRQYRKCGAKRLIQRRDTRSCAGTSPCSLPRPVVKLTSSSLYMIFDDLCLFIAFLALTLTLKLALFSSTSPVMTQPAS